VEEQFKKATVARKHKSITKSMLLEANKDKLVATDIDLSIEGALFEDLHLLLTHNFYGHGFSDLKVKVDTNFNFDRAEFKSVSLVGFLDNREFKAKAEGQLNYSEDLNFEGRASLNCEDANELLPALKGSLDFDSKLQFTYLPKEDVINFKVDNLNSDFFLYGEPTSIKIKNLYGDRVKGFSIDTLDFSQVANNIHIKGNLGTKTSIKGNINLEDLSALMPKLKGSFKGNLAVSGALDKPLIRVRGNSDRISYDDFYVSKLVIDSSYDLDKHKFANTVITDLIRIKKGIKAYRKCTIDISGTLNNHQLTLSCGSATGSYLGAQGGFDEKTSVYQGTLSNLMLVSNVLDPITLSEPVKVKYDFKEQQGDISKVSLSDGFATINFNNTTLVPKGIKTDLVLENLDLSTCEKYLPNHSKLSGKLSLNSHIEYVAGTPNINGELSATQGRLFASNVFLPYKKVYLKLNANEKLLSSQLEVALARDKGQLALNLEVSDPTSTKALKGNLRLNNLALDLFSKVTGSVNSLNGVANANLSVSGSLEKPLIFGDVKLKGDAQPRYNVGSVDDFEFIVNAKGSVGDLKGSFTINETKAYLNGSLDWTDKAYGNLNFNAQNLHLFLLSFGEAMVNVNTNAELNDHLKIKGNISIPKGLIKFNSFGNSGVTPSEDEIFVDEQTNLRQVLTNLKSQELNNDLEIDVKVSLGDELKVNAMGLKADAKGFLNIQKSSTQNQIQGLGKLYLEHGRVDLYGHKFIVNKANANFVGSLDAPQLEAEVVVDPSTVENNVVAGVQVYGTAKKPQITLFSKPTMSQNEIVSYLLYGHGLEKNVQNNNSDNSSSQLLMTLGLGTTTGLLNSIVGVFGMDGVQLGSSGNGDDTQVELQTYLTNKIRLSYGYGVFNSVNEFKLRYELLRRLYVELVSSLDQSVDLIYSFDMD
ncbi:MAG: translocation/assembly module TamB domain-containing protein, partial [Succinivibrio sp.]|nr:translocation/assembly module TamB domain-containing protein [Succinivibrio sp.]